MSKKLVDGEALIEAIRGLMRGEASGTGLGLPALGDGLEAPRPTRGKQEHIILEPKGERPAVPFEEVAGNGTRLSSDQLERIYRMFVRRLLDELPTDPVFLQVLSQQPEIIIELQPRTVKVDSTSTRGRLALLLHEGFFNSGRRQGEARSELARTGSEPNSGQLSTLFGEFVRDRFLERTSGDRYIKAPGLKTSTALLQAAK